MIKLLSIFFLSSTAFAAYLQPFSAASFRSFQSKDKMILLQFHSSHCDVCPDQQRALERIAQIPLTWTPVFMQANFDRERDLKSRYQVSSVSTLLLFKGETEIGRTSGLQNEEDIWSFIQGSVEKSSGKPEARLKRPFHPKR